MKIKFYDVLLLLLCGMSIALTGCARYTIAINKIPDQGGNVALSPAAAEFNSGAVVLATAQPSTGWRFSHWMGDVEKETGNKAYMLMDKNKAITASFVKTYVLSVVTDPKGAGLLSAESGIYDMGTEVVLVVQPYFGWRFDKWGGDISSTSGQVIIKMTSDKKIIAYLVKDEADQR